MIRLISIFVAIATINSVAYGADIVIKLAEDIEFSVPSDSPAKTVGDKVLAPSIAANPDLWALLIKLPADKRILQIGPFSGVDARVFFTPSDGLSKEVNGYGRLKFMMYSTLSSAKQIERLRQRADDNKVGHFLMSDTLGGRYRLQASHFYWEQKGKRNNMVMVDVFQADYLISRTFEWKGSDDATELVADSLLSSIRTKDK